MRTLKEFLNENTNESIKNEMSAYNSVKIETPNPDEISLTFKDVANGKTVLSFSVTKNTNYFDDDGGQDFNGKEEDWFQNKMLLQIHAGTTASGVQLDPKQLDLFIKKLEALRKRI